VDDQEKQATLGTQDEEKQSKNTTQLVLNTTNQTQVTQIGHEPSNKQLEVKDEPNILNKI
jgi:hypothetical protein